jgi:hypothetical protein
MRKRLTRTELMIPRSDFESSREIGFFTHQDDPTFAEVPTAGSGFGKQHAVFTLSPACTTACTPSSAGPLRSRAAPHG